MLKRNGKVANRDDQLSLFDFGNSNGRRNLSDSIRTDGRTPLALPTIVRKMEAKAAQWSTVRRAGDDDRRNGNSHPPAGNRAEDNSAAGARSGVGL